PYLSFDGGDYVRTGALTINQPWTTVLVASVDTPAAQPVMIDNRASPQRFIIYNNGNNGKWGASAGTFAAASTGNTLNTYDFVLVYFSGASSAFHVSGT